MGLDLLLINAPSRTQVYQGLATELAAIEPPVWAGLIARHCLNAGFSVRILDAEAEGLTPVQTAAMVVRLMPRLAAFCVYGQQPSASTQCLPGAEAVARLVRFNAQIPTLALGTHPSALPEKTLLEGPWDYVARGEGWQTIVELLQDLKGAERGAGYQSQSVPGLWYHRAGQALRSSIVVVNSNNLDVDLPNQAWELLDMAKYRAHNWHLWTGDPAGGYASVQTSLGCPFHCSFCCINAPFGSAGIRYWSPSNIAAQIAKLVSDYDITNIKIPDEMFLLNRQHVHQICNHLIDMGLGSRLNIWAYARVDTVKDEQLLSMMRRAGFRWLGIGIESGSAHVRDGVEKGRFDNTDIALAVGRVQSADIAVAANYIFGLPDDTAESMQRTLDLARELNTEWANFYCAMAYPGSELYSQVQIDRRLGVDNIQRLPEDGNAPGWIGYAQHSYDALPLRTPTLTSEEIVDFRDAAFLRYFSRGKYLDMLRERFGPQAVEDVAAMLSYGKPPRRHRSTPR